MKNNLRLLVMLFPFAFAPACDESDTDDDKASDKDDDKTPDDDGDEKGDDDSDDVPLWDCFCEAECDGDVLQYAEAVCSDASTLDLAIDIAVEECAFELEADCFEFDCSCDCEEDPELVCD